MVIVRRGLCGGERGIHLSVEEVSKTNILNNLLELLNGNLVFYFKRITTACNPSIRAYCTGRENTSAAHGGHALDLDIATEGELTQLLNGPTCLREPT